MAAVSLEKLRKQLATLDRDLIELVSRRQKLAAEIGRVKREASIPTRDFKQEKEVIERARSVAAAAGVSDQVAEKLLLLLIESSLTVQEQDLVAAEGTGTGKRVLVFGGRGKMGRWFARFLASQGYAIDVVDPDGADADVDVAALTLDHDITIVAAPLRASNEILHQLAARPPKGLVFDIGSLKSPLRSGLLAMRDAGARITSVHPMFGPGAEMLSGKHVIFVDVGVPEATAEAKQLFAATMAQQIEMDLESHDRLIAYVLGLSHALNIAFFTALGESGEAAPKLAALSSTTFDNQLAIAGQVAGENPHLYYEIQTLNDYGTESLAALLYAVERLRSVIRAGDEREFVALMERGRQYLRGREHGK